MPVSKLKFLFPFLLFAYVQSFAQVSSGSLGDPVVQEDFGSGIDPHFPNTTYPSIGGLCPSSGTYVIAKSTSGCHETWHSVLKDHTGNDGYMMIIDAAVDAGEFYRQQTPALLCGGTKYEFSAYVKNLVLPQYASTHSKPDLTFRIEKLNGELVVPPFSTGPIYETAGADDWQKVAQVITLPADVDAVVVRIINNGVGLIGNDLILDDIAFRAYGPVLQAGFAGTANVTQSNVCEGQPANYTINAVAGAGYTHPQYQWQLNTGKGWENISGETQISLNITFLNASLGTYQYRLATAEGSNIYSANCRVYSNIVTVNVTAYPVVTNIQPTLVCEGEVLTLTATGGANYKWSGPNLQETSQNPLVIPNVTMADAGNYHVDVISAGGCVTSKDVNVTINKKPILTVSGTQTICAGNGTQIMASATDAVSYNWLPVTGLSNPHLANPIANPSISTPYTVTATNANNCVSTNTVQVNVIPLPIVSAGSDKKIFEGQSIKLDGNATGSGNTYSWSPADYLDDPHSPTPIATPPSDRNYLLTVSSANGCSDVTDDVFVRVFQKIVIPDSFTPNNDGINDLWNLEALDTYGDGTVAIYDRRGKQVYFSKGYSKPWDGKQNGSQLPAGTYYYVIDLKNGTRNQAGWVLLMR